MIGRRFCRRRGALRLGGDSRGVAALEFALMAPVLALLFFGIFAISQFARAKMLLSSTASSMASMVASQLTTTSTLLDDFCKGGSAAAGGVQLMMRPYAGTSLSMSIVSYTKKSDSTLNKDWEYNRACQAVATSINTSSTQTNVATPLLPNPGDSVIIVQANYSYISSYTSIVPNMTLIQQAFSRPRFSTIACSGCS
ncbi:MAG TPA: TadE/TadG family type IV pilus assembly protein [Acetobacteraceae bacterium]